MAMSWLIVIAATLAILIPLMATRLRRVQGMLNVILADHHDTPSQQTGLMSNIRAIYESNLATWSSDWCTECTASPTEVVVTALSKTSLHG
jgi:hypothetical protein